ncbi:MAG: hypothetical protein HFJ80_04325 [Clostridiales bacterium]|nr:hypothetical protein [Clostridiales bacterium]
MVPPVAIKQRDRKTGTLKTLAWLENAHSVKYSLIANGISTCSFRLPADDPKARYIQPQSLIEITDNGETVGLFCIYDRLLIKEDEGVLVEVQGRHVIRLLQDKLLFSLHQITGRPLPEVIRYILEAVDENGGRKQSDWVLGNCDYDNVIDYLFENVTLYDALQTITEKWQEPTLWVYDTSVYPFRLSLRRMPQEPGAEIRSGRNLVSLSIENEYGCIANRCYALGAGEGINQLGIMNAENLEDDGQPKRNGHYYVQDDASIAKYGLRESLIIDRSVSDAPLLLMEAKKSLSDSRDPAPIIKVKAADLWSQTRQPRDHFIPGEIVRIVDPELDYHDEMRLWQVSKGDLTGNPGEVELVIGRVYNTVSGAIDKVYRRDQQEKRSSQGATNVWSQSFGDNADREHPVKIVFRLPDDLLNVNKCVLDFLVTPFRAYERGADGGGGGTVGMTADTSSAAGGGETISISSTDTSAEGGGQTIGISANASSADGGGDTSEEQSATYTQFWQPGTGGAPGYYVQTNTKWSYHDENPENWLTEPSNRYKDDGYMKSAWPLAPLAQGTISAFTLYQHWHPHTHALPAHRHSIVHSHTLPQHRHSIVHAHTLPMHTHRINHEHKLPEHTHELEYGIYEEPTLAVAGVRIHVDGKLLGSYSLTGDGVDILRALRTDSNGRVVRGRHTVELTPTPSNTGEGLCKIDGALYIQCFVQSRGDYAI